MPPRSPEPGRAVRFRAPTLGPRDGRQGLSCSATHGIFQAWQRRQLKPNSGSRLSQRPGSNVRRPQPRSGQSPRCLSEGCGCLCSQGRRRALTRASRGNPGHRETHPFSAHTPTTPQRASSPEQAARCVTTMTSRTALDCCAKATQRMRRRPHSCRASTARPRHRHCWARAVGTPAAAQRTRLRSSQGVI